jgi:predicted Zn-dependent protease with MMP-like domain
MEVCTLAVKTLSEKDFFRIVERAISCIPEEIRHYLDNVLISVRENPSRRMLKELGLSTEDSPLGLYVGTAMTERTALDPPLYPDTIYIFRKPIEEMCETMEELEEEIEITVVHEIAHFIGISEDRLIELGYG